MIPKMAGMALIPCWISGAASAPGLDDFGSPLRPEGERRVGSPFRGVVGVNGKEDRNGLKWWAEATTTNWDWVAKIPG